MSNRKDTKAIWQASAALGTIAGLAALCTWQNNRITVSHYRCGSDKLAAPFEGFTILQVSDLHNKRFGKQQHKLLEAIRQQIASAVDIIIHLSRLRDKSRKTMEITEVVGYEDGRIVLNPLYVFEEDENSTLTKVSGRLKRTEYAMKNDHKLRLAGFQETI